MKPREKTEPANYPGFTIRLAMADIAILHGLAESAHYPTVNRLMATMVTVVLNVCESLSVPQELRKENIPQLNRLLWQQLAERDVRRGLPASFSRPIKLTLPSEKRRQIEDASRRLRWSAGQVVVEALQAYCLMAAAGELLIDLPDIIRLSRGDRSLLAENEPESAEIILGRLNLELGLIIHPSLDPMQAPPPPMESSTDIDLV